MPVRSGHAAVLLESYSVIDIRFGLVLEKDIRQDEAIFSDWRLAKDFLKEMRNVSCPNSLLRDSCLALVNPAIRGLPQLDIFSI